MSGPGMSEKMKLYESKVGPRIGGAMMAYDRIESALGITPPEGHLAMAMVLAVSSEAMRDSQILAPETTMMLDPDTRQKLTDTIDLLEYAIGLMKEAMKDGQH